MGWGWFVALSLLGGLGFSVPFYYRLNVRHAPPGVAGRDPRAGVFLTFPSLNPAGPMLYMVVEHFRDGDAVPVYRRFRDRGRLAPPGLEYVGSWVTADFRRCFQLMACDDRRLLDEWMAHWHDVIQFEVQPVMTSAEAVAAMEPRL